MLLERVATRVEIRRGPPEDDHTVINLQNLRKLNANPSSSDDRHAIPAVHPRSNNEESSKQKIENLQSQLRNAVDSCNKAKAAIEKDLEGIKNKNKEIEERNTFIDAAVTELDDEVTKIFLSADKQESWSRRHILLLKGIPRRHILLLKGIPETYGENTNKIAIDLFRDMGINIAPEEIVDPIGMVRGDEVVIARST